ncbi:glycoside hydrolase family 2 [bacterium]|nr:glycoside hydrolase family 2 [bacterium]
MGMRPNILLNEWRVQSANKVGAPDAEICREDYSTRDWYPTPVPSTVMGALIANGVYSDPYSGTHLREIPREPFHVPWFYRTTFPLSAQEAQQTVLLECDGINYAADICLNGIPIASSSEIKGAFRQFQLNISHAAKSGDNVVVIKVHPPHPGDFSIGFVDWNPAPPDSNMGIFRPVRITICDGVTVEHPFVQTDLNTPACDEARLTVAGELVNHVQEEKTVLLRAVINNINIEQEIVLQARERKPITFEPAHYPALVWPQPRLWWPHTLGEPVLYPLSLQVSNKDGISQEKRIHFGIRAVEDYFTEEGHRGFRVNGHAILITGGGWTDDLFLTDTPEGLDTQLQYVKHMNLNSIRLEGIWGKDQTLYDWCDRHGILIMVGWSCHWEHEEYLGTEVDDRFGGVDSAEEIALIAQSWEDQLLWLRHHPSIYVWAVASDKVPHPDLEARYIETFKKYDPTRPYLCSTGGVGSDQHIIGRHEIVSEISGTSGVKMLGPYDYTPPMYWYTDTQRGGAFGFNTETGPGAVVPPLESIKKMIPADNLWPIDAVWDFHCALNEFDALDRFTEALTRRYGEPNGVEDYTFKAQVLNYELMRPMFEAFRANKGRATGIIQWMLNAAWPKMYWQLYDWYFMPTGAFYAARKACQPLQIIYHYGNRGIYVVNDCLTSFDSLTAVIRIFDIVSQELCHQDFPTNAPAESSQKIGNIPTIENLSTAYFLDLRLLNRDGEELSHNFYWLSTKKDELDYETQVQPWAYYTPSKAYADYTSLNTLPNTALALDARQSQAKQLDITITNAGNHIAFFNELSIRDKKSKRTMLPVFWDDNYISLLPGESRQLTAKFTRPIKEWTLDVQSWNGVVHHSLG